MLNDDLVELYYLVNEEQNLKRELKTLRESISEVKENLEEVKTRVIRGMLDINHKFAKFKNMTVTMIGQPEKIKLQKEELLEVIEKIIDMNIDTINKRDQIISAMKPRESGRVFNKLKIKTNKEKAEKLKRESESDA